MNPIDKIIKKLENTQLGFTTGTLKEDGKKLYCAEGILARGILPTKDLEKSYDRIEDACFDNPSYILKFGLAYGINFSKQYKDKIKCNYPWCESDLESLSSLITHYNDFHSSNHKQVAEHLRKLSKVYDLIEGKKFESN